MDQLVDFMPKTSNIKGRQNSNLRNAHLRRFYYNRLKLGLLGSTRGIADYFTAGGNYFPKAANSLILNAKLY